ncbi:MAG: PilZ domain-containing protein [Candidatus Latescibacteria bacterium]|jgi:c-di-GMP-binding flagellar brake protein YcgR|nr:PilZ domain-containing protein [Candidatus Latescibacterota bacterium]
MNRDPASKEAYERLFDIIRPRSETSGWELGALFGLIVLVVGLIWGGSRIRRRREEARTRQAFRLLAQERSLDPEEQALLHRMASSLGKANPLFVFASIAAFEKGVDLLVSEAAQGDAVALRDTADRLQSLRQKLGFDTIPDKWALRHSRQIPVGTRLMVGFKQEDQTRFCSCVVVETDPLAITVAPMLRGDEEALVQVPVGQRLYVRFWLQGDTEYKFRSELLPSEDSEPGSLRLAHAVEMVRLQRRDFFRLPVRIPMVFYALKDEEAARRLPADIQVGEDVQPRLEGVLVNLSAGGAAFRAEGGLDPEERVVMDPLYKGLFPLAGIVCKAIGSRAAGGGEVTSYVEYLNVSSAMQDRLVQKLYQRQLARAQS